MLIISKNFPPIHGNANILACLSPASQGHFNFAWVEGGIVENNNLKIIYFILVK